MGPQRYDDLAATGVLAMTKHRETYATNETLRTPVRETVHGLDFEAVLHSSDNHFDYETGDLQREEEEN